MSDLDQARTAVRLLMPALAGGGPAPVWRTCFSTDDTDSPTGIAPECFDEGHDPEDGSVYTCYPEPVIETGFPQFAEYLAALLNADRGSAA
ncbi:hypothetical protein J7F03_20580 [Streptomyces sp. ISL-43]|uniref:hypothetical protein n=1 Tax=Streptomyces sp. ISL-43 TaxID=2819183 RepID=UPI001BEC6486|nr:hypothetical protein [Streptomyces sp. ISL-43]MBT2449440.1 hypothetical protein [Streptomyces sp. ISL-43]